MQKYRKAITDTLTYILIAFVLVFLFIYPKETSAAVSDALSLCLKSVIPSLFPFLVVSAVVISSGLAHQIGRFFAFLMRKIFRLPGESATAVIIGFLSGYPVGAATAVSMYQSGILKKHDAERLLAFCNNTGPAFLIGAVGIGMFGDVHVGISLYLVHIVSALLVGIIFAMFSPKCNCTECIGSEANSLPVHKCIVSAVKNAAVNTLYIVAFVVFFAVLNKIIFIVFSLSDSIAISAVSSLMEVTSGVSSIASRFGIKPAALIAASGALGWSGLSVHAQVISIVSETDLSAIPYILGKLLHSIIAILLTFLLLIL